MALTQKQIDALTLKDLRRIADHIKAQGLDVRALLGSPVEMSARALTDPRGGHLAEWDSRLDQQGSYRPAAEEALLADALHPPRPTEVRGVGPLAGVVPTVRWSPEELRLRAATIKAAPREVDDTEAKMLGVTS